MKNIESQITASISFSNVSLDGIPKHVQVLTDRVFIGIERMKTSKLFTDDEIKSIQEFATKLINERTELHRQMLISQAREKFRFF